MAYQYINDADVWEACPTDYLWVYDKLILAIKNGHTAGPAGIPVPKSGYYIVRPITNIRMMSKGARKMLLTPNDTYLVPDGFFWQEYFEGDHISVDYHNGVECLTVQGFRDDNDQLDRFSKWEKLPLGNRPFPQVLGNLFEQAEWVNVEYIGNKIIEVHLRWNDDFHNHSGSTIYPVWSDRKFDSSKVPNFDKCYWYPSSCQKRLGFWVLD